MTAEFASTMSKKKVRFGIMCRGHDFAEWEAACIRKLLEVEGATLELLIIDDSPPSPKPSMSERLKSLFNVKTIAWRIYQRLILNRRSRSTRLVSLHDRISEVPAILCRPLQQGRFVQRLRSEDVEAIKAKDLDFILRFAFNILKGDVLEAARFGVWSFHHGDPDRYRGLPPGFWEIYRRDTLTGTVLQRLTERLDAGIMLHKGYFRTDFASYPRSRDTIFFGAADWPASLCRQILAGRGEQLSKSPSSTSAPIYRAPNSLQMLKFVLVTAWSWLTQQWRSVIFSQQWSVGIIDARIEKVSGLQDGEQQNELIRSTRWLAEPKNRFLADPFASPVNGGLMLLVEDYDWSTNLGHISSLKVDERGTSSPIQPIIKLPTHLSYPFLLTIDGKLTCVPESSQSRGVSFFQEKQTGGDWVRSATVLEDVPVIDPTIFWNSDRWWVFGGQGGEMNNTKLYAWHSKALAGPWLPHIANPIKTDVRSSRPAGAPFVHAGQLYRPAQDCSTGYGAAISINRLVVLTPEQFEEETVASIRPDPNGKYPTGLHTVSGAGDWTVIDGSRDALLWAVSWRVLKRKVFRMG
jgi:hypothetical protein